MNSKKNHAVLRRFTQMLAMSFVFAVVFLWSVISHPAQFQGWAYNVTTIQTTVDTRNWQIIAAVVSENVGAFTDNATPKEGKRYNTMELSTMVNSGGTDMASTIDMLKTVVEAGKKDPAPSMVVTSQLVMTFPGKIESRILWHKNSSASDTERASAVVSALGYSLNDAFMFANGGEYSPSGLSEADRVKAYGTEMVAFLQAVDSASKGTSATYKNSTITRLPESEFNKRLANGDDTVKASDFVKITCNGSSSVFQYRIRKGYVSGSDKFGLDFFSRETDIEYLNWAVFAYEGFGNYLMTDENLRVVTETVYNSVPSSFEKLLVEMLSNICNFIKNALGMWSVDELVFNTGVRGGDMYAGGIYPTSWEPVVWALFFVAELAAFLILAIAILQNVLKKAMSTVNPVIRASLMDQIKDILIVAIALGLLPVLMQMIVSLSGAISNIMCDAIGDSSFNERFDSIAAQSGSLGGIMLQIFYLGMLVTLNVFYMIRSYTVALLIILSPIFIVFFAMGEQRKDSGKQWMGELLGNIFIQPIHAIVLGVALLFPSTARPIETLALFYALMPISNVIRGHIFGNGGGGVLGLAQRGVSNAKRRAMEDFRMAKGATKALAAGGGALIGRYTKDGKSESGSESVTESGSTEATPDSQVFGGAGSNGGEPERTYPSVDARSGRDATMQTAARTGYIPSAKPGQGSSASKGRMLNTQQIKKDLGKAATIAGGAAGMAMFGPAGMVIGGVGAAVAGKALSGKSGEGSTLPEPKITRFSNSQLRNSGFDSFKVGKDGSSVYETSDTGYRGRSEDGSIIRDTYGDPAFNDAEVQSYSDMAEVFANGTPEEKAALQGMGFESVTAKMGKDGKTPTGKFSVKTNQNFQQAMGYAASYGADGLIAFSSVREDNQLPRVPDVRKTLNPQSYTRGEGMTKTGVTLSAPTQPSRTISSSQGTPAPSVSQQSRTYTKTDLSSIGMSVAPASSGGTEVTYNAGLMGKDSAGAQVYAKESPMAIQDRESLAIMKDMYESGSDADRSWLQSQGVQSVSGGDDGAVKVVYTEAAQQVMGGIIAPREDGGAVITPQTPDTPVNIVMPMDSEQVQGSTKTFKPSEPHVKVNIPTMNPGIPQ